jgi:hypothetical protein
MKPLLTVLVLLAVLVVQPGFAASRPAASPDPAAPAAAPDPVAPSAAAPSAFTGEAAAVEKVIRASIGWALNKDLPLLYGSLAQDPELFIFHPDSASTIVGFDSFKEMAEAVFLNPKFKATDFQVKDLRIHLSKSKDAAWYSALLDDHGTWDGRKTGWDNARWTGVLEKRKKQWVLVQMHFSLPTERCR